MPNFKWWHFVVILCIPLVSAGQHAGGEGEPDVEAALSKPGTTVNKSGPFPTEDILENEPGSVEDFKQAVLTRPGLHEINGTTLDLILGDVRDKDELFVGVLFYARWCPFSQQLLPLLRTLPELFPQLPIVAVEERAVKPSALSKYGVYSFPLFYIYSKNHRSKFTRPRSLETLVDMITTTTGYNPVAHPKADYCEANLTLLDQLALPTPHSGLQRCPDLRVYRQRVVPEQTCPYRWTFQPSIWASNDLYLILASGFLGLRCSIYIGRKAYKMVEGVQLQQQTNH